MEVVSKSLPVEWINRLLYGPELITAPFEAGSRNVILESDDPVSPENPSFKADYSTLTGIRATKKGHQIGFLHVCIRPQIVFGVLLASHSVTQCF